MRKIECKNKNSPTYLKRNPFYDCLKTDVLGDRIIAVTTFE